MTQLFQGQPSSVMKAKNEFNTLETARDDKGGKKIHIEIIELHAPANSPKKTQAPLGLNVDRMGLQ